MAGLEARAPLPFLYLHADAIVQKTRLLQFTHSGGFFVQFVCKAYAPGNNVIRTPFSLPMLSKQYKTCRSFLNTQVRFGNGELGTALFFYPSLDNLQLSEFYNMDSVLTQHALSNAHQVFACNLQQKNSLLLLSFWCPALIANLTLNKAIFSDSIPQEPLESQGVWRLSVSFKEIYLSECHEHPCCHSFSISLQFLHDIS